MNKNSIEQLQNFISSDKFAEDIWKSRGLNPLDKKVSVTLQDFLNRLATNLMNGINAGYDPERMKTIFKNGLLGLDNGDFDTEEREFVCEYIFQLSEIVDVAVKDLLVEWMYGSETANLASNNHHLSSSEIVSQTCSNCGELLKTKIDGRQADVPDFAYHIVRCNKCKAYNLLDLGAGILGYELLNMIPVELLRKNQYSKEQAIQRLLDLSLGH
jgi:hypothetical protein